ncbi:MAG: hypothetical protein WC916_07910 [Candidatus Woesearchaeota archaeon]
MKKNISIELFEKIIFSICDDTTTQNQEGWTKGNPLWGHCAVISLLAQDIFGGELLRGDLTKISGFEHMRSHYWNLLPDGTEMDFTRSQFGEYPPNLLREIRRRDYVLSYPETAKRYKEIVRRFYEHIKKLT